LILQNYGEQYPIRDVQQLSDSYSTFLTGNSQAAASLPPATAKTVSAGLIGAGIAAVSASLAVLAADGNKGDASDDDVDTAADTSITQPKVSLNPIQNIDQQIAKNNKIILSGTVQDVDSDAAIESVEVHIGSQTYQAQIDKQNWTLTLDAQDLVQQQGENRLTVRAQVADLSGNRAVSEEAEGVYQVDTVAPAATLTLDPVNPS
ncbi:MAG: hypothetical protein Q4E77_06745, partial [Conchiformibius sp.]|nr:hypothetical protein [Conchiformibius sp.]